tara:strand:- start:139 stop:534 length:396 start_codon:yes stop_codon:yes gene_type:complete
MKYIIIKPIDGYDSKQRCEAMNKELWHISVPLTVKKQDDVTSKLFGEVELTSGEYSLHIDEDCEIVVNDSLNIDALVSLFPELTEVEKNGLAAYIENSESFLFKNIIPEGTNLYTYQEMLDLGLLIEIEEL